MPKFVPHVFQVQGDDNSLIGEILYNQTEKEYRFIPYGDTTEPSDMQKVIDKLKSLNN